MKSAQTFTQIPQPMHSSSDKEAILKLGPTSMHNLPMRTTGHDFLHSWRHRFGLHLSSLTIAMRVCLSVSSLDLFRDILFEEEIFMSQKSFRKWLNEFWAAYDSKSPFMNVSWRFHKFFPAVLLGIAFIIQSFIDDCKCRTKIACLRPSRLSFSANAATCVFVIFFRVVIHYHTGHKHMIRALPAFSGAYGTLSIYWMPSDTRNTCIACWVDALVSRSNSSDEIIRQDHT